MNVSIPGSCNQRIARRTALDLIKYKPDIAIIIWSDPARFEFVMDASRRYRHNEDCEQVRPLSVYSYPQKQKHAFLEYYNTISSSQRDIFFTLYNMLATKNIADSLNIPCIQIPFKGTFHRELEKVKLSRNPDYLNSIEEFLEILSSDSFIYGINDDVSFDSICGCDVDSSLLSTVKNQEGHPNKLAHDIMADWLHQLLLEQSLV